MPRARHFGLVILLNACSSSDAGTNRIAGDAASGGSSSTGGAVSATGGSIGSTGGSIGSTGGSIGSTGGAIGSTGGSIGSTGGAIGSTGGSIGSTGGAIGSTGGSIGSTGGAVSATGGSIGSTGGSAGSTGGSIGSTGGSLSSTGGSTTDASVPPDASSDASADVAIPVWFPGSALVDAAQGVMINDWVGSPTTQLWQLCYSTALHARSGQTFHTNCDFKGPSVSIARVSYLTETRVIGGYNSGSWTSPAASTYANNSGSFLFSVTNAFKHSFPGSSTVPYYTLNNKFYGPTFGAGVDWYVHSQLLGGTCAPGYTYQCRTGTSGSTECNTDFCGTPSMNESYVLDALEVWVH